MDQKAHFFSSNWDGQGSEQISFPGLGDITGAEKWKSWAAEASISSADLRTLKIEQRIVLIDDWCRVGDLGFIFAARGLGKTWLAMHLAHGLATQTPVGPWKIHKVCKVLYLDGEMAPSDIRERDQVLGPTVENLIYLNHELLFQKNGHNMNLADPDFQNGIVLYCENDGFEIVFLDNLSTLASGIDENKSIDWELIQPWLLKLRRAGVTVIFIHHAGRNNQLRGSSKREDPANWIVRLDDPNDAAEREGAHFLTRFTKWRGASRQPKTYEWTYEPTINGEIVIGTKESGNMSVFLNHIKNGIDNCSFLAEEMGVSRAYISKLATQAEAKGWLEKKKGKYYLTPEGS